MPDRFDPNSSPDSDGAGSNSFDEFLARYLQGERAAQAGRSIDISRLMSRRTHEVLASAGRFAIEHGHRELDALHILRVLAETEPAAEVIARLGVRPADIADAAEQRLPQAQSGQADSAPVFTQSAQRALFHAYQVARASGSTYIDPEHLFFALVISQDAPAGQVLSAAGITPEALQSGLRETLGEQAPSVQSDAPDASTTPMLDKFGTDLTAMARDGGLDPVIGRADEIEQTVEILSRRTKNNPVLIGEAGVGKTAIVEGLAQRIASGDVPEQLRDKRVVSLDFPAMLGGTRYRGDFEERLTTLMDEISAHKTELIVFIDELHTVVGAGGSGEGGMDAGNILKPRLARGELHVVGATTLKEYRSIEKDSALERRFQPVHVGEPSIDDAVAILSGLRGAYEEHHGVRYTDEAIRGAVELSARYVTDRFLPDKAIDLIDQAGARLRLALGSRIDTSALLEELSELEAAKNSAVSLEHYEEASSLRDRIEAVHEKLSAAKPGPSAAEAVVDEAEIAAVISRATGIPAARLTQVDRERLAVLEDELHGHPVRVLADPLGRGQRPVVQVQVGAAARAPVQHRLALARLPDQVFDHRLDRREAGARGEQDHRLVAVFAQEETSERAFHAQDVFFLQRGEHVVGELAAGQMPQVQFDAGFVDLGVGCVGHRITAARAVAQDELDVLAGVVLEPVVGRQLHLQDRDVRRRPVDAGDPTRHLAHRELAGAGDGARFEHDVGLRRGLAGQHPAGGFFVGAECARLVHTVDHPAFDQPAFARAAGAVLAAIGQADALADRGDQDRLVAFDGENAAARLHGDGETHGRRNLLN